MDLDLSSSDFEVTGINPVYKEERDDGFFEVYFRNLSDRPFHLSFVSFLANIVEKDENLFRYMEKAKFANASEAIADLYDLGFPIEEKVKLHMEKIKSNVDLHFLQKLFELMIYLKRFDTRDKKSYDEDEDETT